MEECLFLAEPKALNERRAMRQIQRRQGIGRIRIRSGWEEWLDPRKLDGFTLLDGTVVERLEAHLQGHLWREIIKIRRFPDFDVPVHAVGGA